MVHKLLSAGIYYNCIDALVTIAANVSRPISSEHFTLSLYEGSFCKVSFYYFNNFVGTNS